MQRKQINLILERNFLSFLLLIVSTDLDSLIYSLSIFTMSHYYQPQEMWWMNPHHNPHYNPCYNPQIIENYFSVENPAMDEVVQEIEDEITAEDVFYKGDNMSVEMRDTAKELDEGSWTTGTEWMEEDPEITSYWDLAEMDDSEMKFFKDEVVWCEEMLRRQARSGIPGLKKAFQHESCEFPTQEEINEAGAARPKNTDMEAPIDERVFDQSNRTLVDATITHIGKNYHTGLTEIGKIYIPIKFTSFLPDVGEKVKMVAGLKGPDHACPLVCLYMLRK